MARSSASSWPGKTSSDVITRTSQRARRSTTSGSSGPSEMRKADVSALMTSDCSAISPPIGRWVVANHDDSAGLWRTLRSDAVMPSINRSRRILYAGDLLGHLPVEPVALAVHVGGVQRVAVLEVPVQRRARTARGLGDLMHADGRGVLPREELVRGVEDAVGRHLGATGRQPVVAGHYVVTRNGTDSGRRT